MSFNDLKALLNEAIKRKEKTLQQACEQTVPMDPYDTTTPISPDSMKPYVLGCNLHKQPKIVSICVTSIGSVCTMSADLVSPMLLNTLLTALCSINLKDVAGDESIGVRLLQTYASILTNPNFSVQPLLVASSLSQLFCLFTMNSKGSIINSTARATITQLTSHYFEVCKTSETTPEQAASIRVAALLLRDLCHIAGGDLGTWLRLSSTSAATQSLALDLTYDVLSGHHEELRRFSSSFYPCLREDLCPLVVRGISTISPLLARHHRLAVSLLQQFMDPLGENLDILIGIQTAALDPKTMDNLYVKVAVLIPWRATFQSPAFLKHMAAKSNRFGTFFANVCALLSALADILMRSNNDKLAIALSADRIPLTKLEATHVDDVRPQDAFLLCFDIVTGVSSNLAKLVDREKGVADPCVSIYVDLLWTQILQECTKLLEVGNDDDMIQSTLRCCQHMTHCCGWSQKTAARDSFITCMTKHALPLKGQNLTTNNAAVIKTLVNISNGLASVLGSSWYMILKTFQQVECILTNISAEQAAVHDVAMLHALLDNVVEASRYIDDKALMQMLNGLVQVSTDIAQGREALRARPGYFSLAKMTLAVKNNLPRLGLIQELISTHYITMAALGEDVELRKFSVECTSSCLLTYFQSPFRNNGSVEVDITMFGTLAAIHKRSAGEVRFAALVELHKLFQQVGQALGSSCLSMTLTMLHSTASSLIADEVAYGYRTIELICQDFLSTLDTKCMLQLINCVAAYIQQTASGEKVNLNLSAIQLAWQIGDYCSSQNNLFMTTHWLTLFSQLRDASVDSRPEVRHGALKTLFSLLVTHGHVLPTSIRPTVLWDILLNLIESVQSFLSSKAKISSATRTTTSPPGASGAPELLVHHSRNTAEKQWGETVAVTVEGCMRATRMFHEQGAAAIDRWSEFLQRLTIAITNSMQLSIDEVVIVGIKSLRCLISDLTVDGKVTPSVVWETAWVGWEAFAEREHPNESSTQMNLSLFIEGVSEHKEKCPGSWTNMSTRRMFQIIEKVLKTPAATISYFYPSKVQAAVLLALKKCPPFAENGQWEVFFTLLSSLLPPASVVESATASELLPAQVQQFLVNSGYHHDFVEAVLHLIQETFAQCQEIKILFAPDIVRAINNVIMTRFVVATSFRSWKVAVTVLRALLTEMLSASGVTRTYQSSQLTTLKEVSVLLHKFYFSPTSQAKFQNGGISVEPEDLCCIHIASEILAYTNIGTDATKAFLQFLEKCTIQSTLQPVRLEALRSLFQLVDVSHGLMKSEFSAVLALPVLYARCKTLLTEFVSDEKSAGKVPLPSYRVEEVLFVLQALRDTTVLSTMWSGPCWAHGASPTKVPQPVAVSGPRGLLVRMFPTLCEILICRDDNVRTLLAALCKEIATELGIQ